MQSMPLTAVGYKRRHLPAHENNVFVDNFQSILIYEII